jgi:hypothetical protein
MEDKVRNLVNELPPDHVAKELVENFFSEANWFFLVLERYYFTNLHSSWLVLRNIASRGHLGNLPHELQYFLALLFQVLAVALQFLPPNTESSNVLDLENSRACDQLSQKYSKIGMEIMQLLGRHNSALTAVQHDLMRALWLKNCCRGTESWYSLGDAIRSLLPLMSSRKHADSVFRQAQDLGLHLQCSVPQAAGGDVEETLARLWYDEYKRRLWVTLFTWDRLVCASQ